MCVILYCPGGERPSEDVLLNCWAANPDGAGLMYASGGAVHGVKGLMRFRDLEGALGSVPGDAPLVVHFRIGTSGGLSPEVTHPYPVSADLGELHSLEWEAPLGIAHNGVIPGVETDDAAGISDTVAYVMGVAAPLSARMRLTGKRAKRALSGTSVGSRLAVMDSRGRVSLIGSGWNGVGGGIQASNGSWKPFRAPVYRTASHEPLPGGFCSGCPYGPECEVGVPMCLEVASAMGYSPEDVDGYWGAEGWY